MPREANPALPRTQLETRGRGEPRGFGTFADGRVRVSNWQAACRYIDVLLRDPAAAKSNAQHRIPAAEANAEFCLCNITALLVIACPRERAALSSTLQEAHCTVSAVGTYREALQVLARYAFAVIVCNPTFVDGSWEDIIGQIAPMQEPPAVVLATSRPEQVAHQDAITLGASSVLRVPSDREEILEILKSAARSGTGWYS